MADAAGAQSTGADPLRRALVGGFFALLVVVGLLSFRDFGVSWDETEYYRYGELTHDFYVTGDRSFESFLNLRYYGPAIPLLHASVADAFDVSPRSAIPVAHLVNFLIFVAGVGALYQLLLIQTRRWQWALFGAAALVLSPRIFSHAFVNPKDGPFLSLLTINMYLLVRYLETRKRMLVPALSVASALLIDMRVLGVIAVGLVVAGIALDTISTNSGARLRAFGRPTAVYLACVVPIVLALWPYLWPDPLSRFWESVSVMRRFTTGPAVVFFRGREIPVTDLPWYYAPVWVGITTPIAYLALAAVGLTRKMPSRFITLFRTRSVDRHYLLYAGWLLGVPLVTILGNTPLYDEWRHLNFVYPALIIFAVAGAQGVHAWLGARTANAATAFAGALVLALVSIGVTMARLHPYEALYFNKLAGGGSGAQGDYELDYWGLSYREGLSFLLAEHPGRQLKVHACTFPGTFNAGALSDGARLHFVDELADADFAICTPRSAFPGADPTAEYLPAFRTVFTVARDGATFLYVKDLHAPAD